MNINLDYKRPEPKPTDPPFPTNAELTVEYITYATRIVYPQGFNSASKQRTFGRLQRKMDDALDSKSNEIDLADDEKEMLIDVFSKLEGRFPIELSKYVVVLMDEINAPTIAKTPQQAGS